MCYLRCKIEGGNGALRESDDKNFLKPKRQSRNLNIYDSNRSKQKLQTTSVPRIKWSISLKCSDFKFSREERVESTLGCQPGALALSPQH